MLVVAKTRAGKGTGIVIPTLLTWAGSVICIDVKGENHAITARQRAKFGPVWKLDLDNPLLSARYNPMDIVRFGTMHQVDDAKELADLMNVPDPRADSHWDDKAKPAIAALILAVMEENWNVPAMCTLTRVRELVAQMPCDFEDMLTELVEGSHIAFVRETAMGLLAMENSPEFRSIKSTMDKITELWGAGSPVATVCQQSDFDLMTFMETPQSLFICVPDEKLDVAKRFMRVITGVATIATVRAAKQVKPPEHPTLILVDEAAALGYMRPLEKAAGLIAAYARMIVVFQDLSQLRNTYRDADTFLANAGCQVFFGVNDTTTAKMLADRIGHTTVKSHSMGLSQGWDDVLQHRNQAGMGEASRYLIDAAEIIRLSTDEAMIFMRDQITAPIRAKKFDYRFEKAFNGMWDSWRGTAAPVSDTPLALEHVPVLALPSPAAVGRSRVDDAVIEGRADVVVYEDEAAQRKSPTEHPRSLSDSDRFREAA